jgi:hypothetical protein
VDKYKKVMQHILKDITRNMEVIFVKTVNTCGYYYHPLFETFRDEILLPDFETGVVTDANLNSLLTFSNLNEIPSQDLATPPADSLFLFNFDLNPTAKPEEIRLEGIDQLPTTADAPQDKGYAGG